MSKYILRFALTLAALTLLEGCRQPNQFVPPPPPTVTVAHPIERAVADTVEFVGTTEPTKTVDLRAKVSGYLEKIYFEDGANVTEGQALFLIEQAPYQSALDAAKAAQQKASASLALAQTQYRRMEPLRLNNVVTQDELDVQAAQVKTSQADLAAADAAVRKAELDLGYTKISAPIAGRIGRHMVDIGNLVMQEQTQLATIQAVDPIYVYFDVSENDLLRFMAMLRNKELPDPDKNPPVLRVGLANEQGFPHEGRLDFRDISINQGTGTALRRAVFPNPGWQLIPGMFVRVQADVGSPKPRLLVEERAIGSDQRGEYLLVVNEKNTVDYRPIKTGIRVGDLRVIESGITASDWVVVNGLQRARPGSQVKPERTTMATNASQNAPTAPANAKEQAASAASQEETETAAPSSPAKPSESKNVSTLEKKSP